MFVLRYTEAGVEKSHRLKSGTTLVGRLPSCDLVLADPGVSRHHASFRLEGSHCFVLDAGSRFGTSQNGHRIASRRDFGDRLVEARTHHAVIHFSKRQMEKPRLC